MSAARKIAVLFLLSCNQLLPIQRIEAVAKSPNVRSSTSSSSRKRNKREKYNINDSSSDHESSRHKKKSTRNQERKGLSSLLSEKSAHENALTFEDNSRHYDVPLGQRLISDSDSDSNSNSNPFVYFSDNDCSNNDNNNAPDRFLSALEKLDLTGSSTIANTESAASSSCGIRGIYFSSDFQSMTDSDGDIMFISSSVDNGECNDEDLVSSEDCVIDDDEEKILDHLFLSTSIDNRWSNKRQPWQRYDEIDFEKVRNHNAIEAENRRRSETKKGNPSRGRDTASTFRSKSSMTTGTSSRMNNIIGGLRDSLRWEDIRYPETQTKKQFMVPPNNRAWKKHKRPMANRPDKAPSQQLQRNVGKTVANIAKEESQQITEETINTIHGTAGGATKEKQLCKTNTTTTAGINTATKSRSSDFITSSPSVSKKRRKSSKGVMSRNPAISSGRFKNTINSLSSSIRTGPANSKKNMRTSSSEHKVRIISNDTALFSETLPANTGIQTNARKASPVKVAQNNSYIAKSAPQHQHSPLLSRATTATTTTAPSYNRQHLSAPQARQIQQCKPIFSSMQKVQKQKMTINQMQKKVGTTSQALSIATPWIRQFLSKRMKDCLLVIPRDYLQDNFNLARLAPIVERVALAEMKDSEAVHNDVYITQSTANRRVMFPHYEQALQLILRETNEQYDNSIPHHVQKAAEVLYYLVHARYAVSPRGLDTVRRRLLQTRSLEGGSNNNKTSTAASPIFGRCPKVNCKGMPLLPYGELNDYELLAEARQLNKCKRYCCMCNEKFFFWDSVADGCCWGTSFCHLFLMTHGNELLPAYTQSNMEKSMISKKIMNKKQNEKSRYVHEFNDENSVKPQIFGFKIHPGITYANT